MSKKIPSNKEIIRRNDKKLQFQIEEQEDLSIYLIMLGTAIKTSKNPITEEHFQKVWEDLLKIHKKQSKTR